MQCTTCGTTLQPGVTTCPSCGVAVPTDTSESSPYETYAETVPYIPYNASGEKAPAPASSPSSGTPALEQSFYGPSPLGESSMSQGAPPTDQDSQASQSDIASPSTDLEPPANEVAQPQPPLALQEPMPQPPLPTPTQPVSKPRRGLSASVTALFIILTLLIFGGGGGLAYYATIFHPAELHAQATVVAQNVAAEATARSATINPQQLYTQITSSTPSITDPLNNVNSSIWEATTSCNLTNGAYHASIAIKSEIVFCRALSTDFHNVAFQVQMTILKGDLGGLMFRGSLDASNQVQSYFFALDPVGGYHLFTLLGGGLNPLREDTSPAITSGLNKPNLITVIARDNRFYLYVNKQFVAVVRDNLYSSGLVGLFALDLKLPTDVVFSNAQMWAL
jgi:hypothetical protein